MGQIIERMGSRRTRATFSSQSASFRLRMLPEETHQLIDLHMPVLPTGLEQSITERAYLNWQRWDSLSRQAACRVNQIWRIRRVLALSSDPEQRHRRVDEQKIARRS